MPGDSASEFQSQALQSFSIPLEKTMLIVQYTNTSLTNHPPVLDATHLNMEHNRVNVHQLTYTDPEGDLVAFSLVQQPEHGKCCRTFFVFECHTL